MPEPTSSRPVARSVSRGAGLRSPEPGTLREPEGAQAWEVFRQEKDGDPMTHAGNLLAPDAELALHYARELAGRRQESTRIWVVPRSAVNVLDDPDLLQPPLDRSFKKPGGYVMRDKLRAARGRASKT
jgi:ring-1,2-phenylacetyl-CoA epoxidase subunit PaaB